MKRLNIFLVFCMLGLFMQIDAQVSLDLSLNTVQVNKLSDFVDGDEDQANISLTNMGDDDVNIKLGFSLKKMDGVAPLFEVKSTLISNQICFDLPGGQTDVYSGFELEDLFNESSIEFIGITQTELETNPELGEGMYEICASVSFCNDPSVELSSSCATFTVISADAPTLISLCAQEIDIETESQLNLNWMFIPPPGFIDVMEYIVRIVEVEEGQNANEAIEGATDPVTYEETFEDILSAQIVIPDDILLEAGTTYAIQIMAIDETDAFIIKNDGKSEVCTFQTLANEDEITQSGLFETHYPQPDDRIPFSFFPIIIKFSPYSDDYKRHDFEFNLNGTEGYSSTNNNHHGWQHGPLVSQQNNLDACGNNVNLDSLRSQYLAYNAVEEPVDSFAHKEEYNWGFAGRMKDADFDVIPNTEGALSGTFTMGMSESQLISPADKSILTSDTVQLKFLTAEAPDQLLPDFYIFHAKPNSDPIDCHGYEGVIYETCKLQVSRDTTFENIDSIKFTKTFTFDGRNPSSSDPIQKFSGLYTDGQKDLSKETAFKDALYKEMSTNQFVLADTGRYFWRVTWLTDPADENSIPYETSEVWEFRMQQDTSENNVDPPAEEGDCLVDCNMETPIGDNPKSIEINSVIKVGKFDMTIRSVTGSISSGFAGTGIIRIPFLRNVNVKVTYTDVKVNGLGFMFEGSAVADKDFDFQLEILNNSAVNNALSFAGVDKDDINEKLEEPARWVSLLQDGEMALPLALDRSFGDEDVLIGLMDMKFNTSKATMQVVLNTDLPFGGDVVDELLSFGSVICFGPNGLENDNHLYRINDQSFTPPGGYDFVIKGLGDTGNLQDTTTYSYVTWNCKGLKKVHIAGEVIFPREDLLPTDELGNPIAGNEKVKGLFRVAYTKGKNLITALDFNHPFQHPSLEDWIFTVDSAFIDASDLENPPNINFPPLYEDASVFDDETSNLWHGVYLKNLKVKVPERHKSFNQTGRLEFLANNIIINKGMGVTADINALNILEYPNGNLDGWQYSLDTIAIKLVSNSLRQGRLAGKIRVVGFDSTEFLKYHALFNRDFLVEADTLISNGTSDTINADTVGYFEFVVQPNKDHEYNFNSIKSKLSFEDDSSIKAAYTTGGGWNILASLNGEMNLDQDLANTVSSIPMVSFTGVKFQGFQLGNKEGFEPGNWSLTSPPKFIGGTDNDNGFPVNLRDVTFVHESAFGADPPGLRMGLSFEFDITLADIMEGKSNLTIWGKLSMPESNPHFLAFDGVELDDIAVAADFGVVSVGGAVQSYENDPVFGNGFGGELHAAFELGDGFEGDIEFNIGRVNNHNYWLLDVDVSIPKTLLFSGLYLTRVGGGIYHNMQMTEVQNYTDFSESYTFLPNNETYLGVALSARVETQTQSTFNADARLTAEFSDSGINLIDFRGMGYMMSTVEERDNPKFLVDLSMTLDFGRGVLEGGVKAYVAVPATSPNEYWIKGNASGSPSNNSLNEDLVGYAGEAVMYFDSDGDWKIVVGEPGSPLSVNFLDMANATSYFMVGNIIPDVNIGIGGAGVTDGTASGIAWGAELILDTVRKTFLVFYGEFSADIGYDIAIQKSHEPSFCAEADGGVKGINGWYASGRLGAHFDGSVGIEVDVFGFSGSYEIFRVYAGVDLLAKLPNPTYFMGHVSGGYSILGGVISGHCNFKVELGSQCSNDNASPVGFDVIGQVTPDENEAMEVYTFPQASFNLKLNSPIELIDDDGQRNFYKAVLHEFKIFRDGYSFSTPTINDEQTLASLNHPTWLEGEKEFNLLVSVKWQVKEDGESTYKDVITNGQLFLEKREYTFFTKKKPDEIPAETVIVHYPLNKQRFYLQDERREGLIKLNQLPDLELPGIDVEFIARLIPKGQDTVDLGLISLSNPSISFDLPTLTNSKIYSIELVRRLKAPEMIGGAFVNNLVMQTQFVTTNATLGTNIESHFSEELRADSTWLEVTTATLQGSAQVVPNKVIYKYHFKTSEFNTLASKLEAMGNDATTYAHNGGKELLGVSYGVMPEGFDKYDVDGWSDENGQLQPLVSFYTKWHDFRYTWMRKVRDSVLVCAIENNRMESLEEIEPTVFVGGNYQPYQLLTDQELNNSSPISWWGQAFTFSGFQMSSFFGHVELNSDPYRMRKKSNPIISLGMLSSSANVIAPVLYGTSFGSNNLMGGGGGLVIDVYPPGPTGFLPSLADPSLNISGFYLRYETSLFAYDLYEKIWNQSRYGGFIQFSCNYFQSGGTAPPYFKIKNYPANDYKISSSYRLNSIFQNTVSDHLSEDILNFKVQ